MTGGAGTSEGRYIPEGLLDARDTIIFHYTDSVECHEQLAARGFPSMTDSQLYARRQKIRELLRRHEERELGAIRAAHEREWNALLDQKAKLVERLERMTGPVLEQIAEIDRELDRLRSELREHSQGPGQ